MGHIDHGRAQRLVQTCDLEPHLHAQGRIKVGQRFVEQESLRLPHDRAADGHALALSTRKGLWPPLQVIVELENLGRLGHLALDLRLGNPGGLETETDILAHRHVRIESIGLEHHGQATA